VGIYEENVEDPLLPSLLEEVDRYEKGFIKLNTSLCFFFFSKNSFFFSFSLSLNSQLN
jgi:hypothetical protein